MGWNYIIGVRHTVDKEFNQKFKLDSFIKYEDIDQEKMDYVQSLLQNKLLKTPPSEAYDMADLKIIPQISHEIHGLTLRVRSNNNVTTHKFHTEFEMDGDDMDGYISTASIVESTREMLQKSRINL